MIATRTPPIAPAAAESAIVPAAPGDDEAYAALIDALRRRRLRVDALRGDVTAIRAGLARFENECQSRVGDLLASLRRLGDDADLLQRRLQDALAAAVAANEDALDDILEQLDVEHDFRFDQAGRGDGIGDGAPSFGGVPGATGPDRPADRATLKRLYRDLAKRCHPDLGKTDAERVRRAALMQRVNESFSAGDASALKGLLLETESDDPGFGARPVADRLSWAQAELARLDGLLADLRGELASLQRSDLHRLWRRHEAGAPVFDELADDLEARVRAEGQRLDRLTASYRKVAPDYRADANPQTDALR